MREKNEELLAAWLRLSTAVINERLTSDLPYNEALLCNILHRNQQAAPGSEMTATDLCRHAKMLKSQMNRTLQNMEEKGIIIRKRSAQDRRQVYVSLNPASDLYQRQHEKIMDVVGRIAEKLGYDQIDDIIQIFTKIADTADEVLL